MREREGLGLEEWGGAGAQALGHRSSVGGVVLATVGVLRGGPGSTEVTPRLASDEELRVGGEVTDNADNRRSQ